MRLELRHLRLIVSIAERRSIGAAARELGIAQPAVSAQLRRIEAELGCALFRRHAGGARPTRAGDLVIERARSLLDDAARLAHDLPTVAEPTGPLCVGGHPSSAFALFLAQALPVAPRGLTSLTNSSTTVLDEWLTAGTVDLVQAGIHPGFNDRAPAGMRQQTYVETEPFLVAIAAGHPLAQQPDIGLDELRDAPWILPRGRPDGTMSAFLAACRSHGFEPRSPVGTADLNYYASWITDQAAVCLATPGHTPREGIALIPLRDGEISGRLVIRWDPDCVGTDELALIRELLVTTYVQNVLSASERAPWWTETPQHRPTVSDDLAHLAPQGWTHQ